MDTENISHPDGVEVKLSAKSINIRGLIYFFILLIAGTCLFVYVWDEFSSYNIGYRMGTIGKQFKDGGFILFLLLLALVYMLIQTGVLYWFSGKNRKSLRWQGSLTGVGFYLTCPITLKYYRVALLLPGILLGLLPTIHGFCTGNAIVFYMGMFGLLTASADTYFWYKLRPFDEEDLLLANNSFYDVTIIKRNYRKNN
ncbi:hypothetical protein [Bacteroides sp.]|uniref:hypothetical protein n=1 Tax=Bacteroides sp. TaxID=29523 RepID=UPI002620727D|nr:hypothetical protein [Bacteroides sp.]